MARSKVISRPHQDVAHLQINVPTEHQHHTPLGFRDVVKTGFFLLPTSKLAHPEAMGENNTHTVLIGCAG